MAEKIIVQDTEGHTLVLDRHEVVCKTLEHLCKAGVIIPECEIEHLHKNYHTLYTSSDVELIRMLLDSAMLADKIDELTKHSKLN